MKILVFVESLLSSEIFCFGYLAVSTEQAILYIMFEFFQLVVFSWCTMFSCCIKHLLPDVAVEECNFNVFLRCCSFIKLMRLCHFVFLSTTCTRFFLCKTNSNRLDLKMLFISFRNISTSLTIPEHCGKFSFHQRKFFHVFGSKVCFLQILTMLYRIIETFIDIFWATFS